MKDLNLGRYVLCSCVAAAMLAGCGGSQPLIGAPGATPQTQTSAIATHAEPARSRMLPEATREDLVYVESRGASTPAMRIFAYPSGKLVGTFNAGGIGGLCTDAQGNVYVPSPITQQILEYAHGATLPFKSLSVPGYAYDCSVDPTTGNLAVLFENTSNFPNLAIYENATGAPTLYEFGGIYCGYDGYGNLFVDNVGNNPRFRLSELAKGSNGFVNVTVGQFVDNPGQLQWDGSYITVQDQFQPGSIYRLRVSGSAATLVGKTRFRHIRKFDSQSWIWNGKVAIGIKKAYGWVVEIWKYPAGGTAVETLQGDIGKAYGVYGITVSVAPRH